MKKLFLSIAFAMFIFAPSSAMAVSTSVPSITVAPVIAQADGGDGIVGKSKGVTSTVIKVLKYIGLIWLCAGIIIMLKGDGYRHFTVGAAGFLLLWAIEEVATALGGEADIDE